MKGRLIVAAILVALVAPAVASSASNAAEKPDVFYARLLSYDFKGQWERAWALLHPGQQRYVKLEKFVECEQQNAAFAGADLVSVKKIETYRAPIRVVGVPQRTSTAVTLRITVTDGTVRSSFTRTFHAVWTGRRWAWVFANADVSAYRAGRCPG